MKLIYKGPKSDYPILRSGWPMRDHDEKDRKVAQEKIDSGYFAKEEPPKPREEDKETS